MHLMNTEFSVLSHCWEEGESMAQLRPYLKFTARSFQESIAGKCRSKQIPESDMIQTVYQFSLTYWRLHLLPLQTGFCSHHFSNPHAIKPINSDAQQAGINPAKYKFEFTDTENCKADTHINLHTLLHCLKKPH